MSLYDQHLNIVQAKEIDLVDYLASLGHQPTKIRNADHWYLPPLRKEKHLLSKWLESSTAGTTTAWARVVIW